MGGHAGCWQQPQASGGIPFPMPKRQHATCSWCRRRCSSSSFRMSSLCWPSASAPGAAAAAAAPAPASPMAPRRGSDLRRRGRRLPAWLGRCVVAGEGAAWSESSTMAGTGAGAAAGSSAGPGEADGSAAAAGSPAGWAVAGAPPSAGGSSAAPLCASGSGAAAGAGSGAPCCCGSSACASVDSSGRGSGGGGWGAPSAAGASAAWSATVACAAPSGASVASAGGPRGAGALSAADGAPCGSGLSALGAHIAYRSADWSPQVCAPLSELVAGEWRAGPLLASRRAGSGLQDEKRAHEQHKANCSRRRHAAPAGVASAATPCPAPSASLCVRFCQHHDNTAPPVSPPPACTRPSQPFAPRCAPA